MIAARPVTRDHVVPLIRLAVAPAQAGLVAENAVTLAQAAYETGSGVWGLWDGEAPMGLFAMIDPRAYPWLEEGDDPEAAYLWRLMIDARHQGRGFGRAALGLVADQVRSWGLPRVAATVVDRPDAALPFYERAGFRRTGRIVDGEVEVVLDLR